MNRSPLTKLHIAMLSIHSSPLGPLGSRDTGGMSIYVQELSRWLGKNGHKVDIFTAQFEPSANRLNQLFPGVRLINLCNNGDEFIGKKKSNSIDIIGVAAEIENYRGQSAIKYDLIHSNYWISGLVGEILKRQWHCPQVITFHTLASAKNATSVDHEEKLDRLEQEQHLIKTSDIILAPTMVEKQRSLVLNGAPTGRVHILGCGVDLEKFRPLPQTAGEFPPKEQGRAAQILFVGRFDPMKGLPDLLESLTLLTRHQSNTQLVLVGGDGPASTAWQNLSRLAEDLGIQEKVEFVGRVRHDQLAAYYNAARIVVMPSRYESFGLVTLEALACGTPVAATRVGIAADIIADGVNGYLADPGNPESLATAINFSLELAARRDRQYIRGTVEKYGWEEVAKNLIDVYNNSLNTSYKYSI